MLQVVAIVAAVGTVLWLERSRESALETADQLGRLDAGWQAESGQVGTYGRCGAGKAGRQFHVEDVAYSQVSPWPNSYMYVNGRLFTLGDALACTSQLHVARVN